MKLLFPLSLILVVCSTDAALRADRRLSYEKIAEYEPLSKVTDHVSSIFSIAGDAVIELEQDSETLHATTTLILCFAKWACIVLCVLAFSLLAAPRLLCLQNAIDLDQKEMEKQLALETSDSFALAKNIYENGAHSKSIAEVTIAEGAPAAIPAGAAVVGKTTSGQEVRGEALEAAASGASVLRIQYDTSTIQEAYVDCQVGALEKDGNTNGCKKPIFLPASRKLISIHHLTNLCSLFSRPCEQWNSDD